MLHKRFSFQLVTLIVVMMFCSGVHAVSGKLDKIVGYSYISGLQLYWTDEFENPTSCSTTNRMTIRGDDVNGQAMISMVYMAYAANLVISCAPKVGCNGINNQAEVNYCVIQKQ